MHPFSASRVGEEPGRFGAVVHGVVVSTDSVDHPVQIGRAVSGDRLSSSAVSADR
ncbi:hypothetical protein TOK_5930 [Pseudonocardia sp. N23]|nr:hypothetical protein TOK_5930 [Pseudonocardia sp. N23]